MGSVRQEPVAIIGMGCILPDAHDVPTFFRNLQSGHVSVRELKEPRWDWSRYGSSDPEAVDRTYSRLGAPAGELKLDWKRFRLPPIETRLLHTMELMLLEAAHQAMTGAGYTPERTFPRERVAVIAGSSGMGRKSNQCFNFKWRLPELLDTARRSPALQQLSTGQAERVLDTVRKEFIQRYIDQSDDWAFWGFVSPVLGRICGFFGLQGPHFCVDAHAASGLAALETGVQGLMSGEWDMALVGAASPALSLMECVLHSKLRRLSTRGVFPLDARADGTALGEGAVMLLIKRLEDAERDGDTIHAVLRGVAGVNQGSGPVMTATHAPVHQRAASEALLRAGVQQDAIAYLETGATGVTEWDAHLIEGLGGAYQGARQVSLGAVAESVGDLQAASSFAAMLKVIHSLRTRELLPQRTFQTRHPGLPLEGTPFRINEARTWPEQGPRLAAIHAAGFGGIAYHAVLEEYVPRVARPVVAVAARATRRAPEPIAIVGMACRYAGADDPQALWERALQGLSAVDAFPEERWPVSLYRQTGEVAFRNRESFFKVYAPKAALVKSRPFAYRDFGLPPSAVAQMDHTHLWCLEVAREAVRDAGYGPSRALPSERTAVIVAVSPGNHRETVIEARLAYPEFADVYRRSLLEAGVASEQVERFIEEAREAFQRTSPPSTSETLPGILTSAPATRLARALDARGPAFTVESACASSLNAVSLSMQGLRDGRWDLAVTGGAWSQITVPFCVSMCYAGVISPTGQPRPFSRDADGFVHGEGCGLLVLKRLSDARRDGDRIHALIRGAGGSSDGFSRSLFASQEQGQELAIRRALADGGLPPSSIQYIEAHGSGMPEGDIPEAGALLKVYGRKDGPASVGVLKPIIGHSYVASGTAGLIRTVLALRHQTLPPSLTQGPLNPRVPWDGQLAFPSQAQAWAAQGVPRRAAVNSYGLGGINYHAVLEEYVE
ncbi:polyketide synthase [Corallococcus sp. bb12-1]|uniref:beta-ketoacyl [acyl carrier protein] synthase domain-containing protein n=1 Tax=Corallococcus sp. bb12-1 TaxID=2996784 RepID=UPI00226E4F62|nr:polyketide synthase [Corallococcus sp. bb12-1]MCY1042213.1 polyketide synthase [Corallococcus sp. bb12-1]